MGFAKRVLLASFMGVYLSIFFMGAAASAAWTAPINLSNTAALSRVPAIAISNNGKLHVVWAEALNNGAGEEVDDIFYASSTNNGASFSSPVNISNSPNNQSGEPVIAIAADQNSNVHVVWEEYGLAGDPNGAEVMYALSTNSGATWSDANKKNISNTPGFSGSAYIFIDDTASHNVHVSWTECTDGDDNCEINYSRSVDSGSTFSARLNLSNNSEDNDQVTIVADATAVHLSWQQDQSLINYARSTSGGASFEAKRTLSVEATTMVEPAMVLDGQSRLHVVWTQFGPTGTDISWTRSTDNGVTFGGIENRSNTPLNISQTPTIASPGGGNVTIVWSDDNQDGAYQNWSVNSPNGGSSWQAAGSIAGPGAGVVEPALVFKGANLYLTWEENGEVKFSRGS